MMNRLLVCATEAGGSRNLSPVVDLARRRGSAIVVYTRPGCAGLWDPAVDTIVDATDADLVQEFDRRPADVVICGTSSYPDLEVAAMAEAQRRSVPVLAIVDERYEYMARFSVGGRLRLPTAVALIDDDAVREAVAEGLPQALCHPTGSPALAALVAMRQRFAVASPARPAIASGSAPVVTFVSETMAACYGTAPERPGPLGPYLGYTEDVVRTDILSALATMSPGALVIEKVHPAARSVPVPDEAAPVRYVAVRDVDLPALLWHSDLVIGMRSMALLEAALLGVPALSYQPGLRVAQRCTAVRLGVVPCVSSLADMVQWCRASLDAGRARPAMAVPAFARPDAAERVLELAAAIARRNVQVTS